MKIIFLNLWHGKLQKELKKFARERLRDTDVFCFQESDPGLDFLFPDYTIMRASKPVGGGVAFFQETLLRPDLQAISFRTLLEDQKEAGLALYSEVGCGERKIHILNVHGHFAPKEKTDCPERLLQSQVLIDFFRNKEGLKIIGGDFNILPDQKSIRMFEESGYRDLIKDFKIPTTRNHLAWENYPIKLYYSDYVFVSPEVKVKSFSVPNLEISDHLPLILEMEL